jgi:hypothetical protein
VLYLHAMKVFSLLIIKLSFQRMVYLKLSQSLVLFDPLSFHLTFEASELFV